MGKTSNPDSDDASALDDELAKVVMAIPEPAEPRSAPTVAAPGRSAYGLLATLLVMGAGIVALFFFGFKDAAVYSISLDKLLAQGAGSRRVRIEGELVPGSLTKRDKPCEYRFHLRGAGKDVEIHYPQCGVPDTFRDVPQGGVLVTAEGKLTEGGFFEASLLLAKCSSKYDAKTHSMSAAPTDAM